LLLDAVNAGSQCVKPLIGLLCSTCGSLSRRIGLLRRLVDRIDTAFECADSIVHGRYLLVDIVFRGARAEAESAHENQAGCQDAPT